MSLTIRTNVASLNAQRNLSSTQNALSTSMARLSSGYRITSAADDAAGLGISTKLNANIRSYNQAARNANDGISIVQSAEAALNESANILTRLRELATESASDGIGNTERGYVQKEAKALTDELERIAQVTDYNGTKLLNNATSSLDFQVGIGNSGNDRISFTTINATTAAAGLNVTGLDISSKASAQAALDTIDAALQKVSSSRADLGALGNRFQSAINNIQAFSESLSAANSRIKDVDIAQETSNMAQYQILQQAGISVLSQANQTPQMALKLLGG